jgi:hypothetical protein
MLRVCTHGRCLGPEGNADAAPPDPDVAPPPPLNSVNDIFCPLAMVDKYYGAIRDTKAKYESLSGIGDNQLLSVPSTTTDDGILCDVWMDQQCAV